MKPTTYINWDGLKDIVAFARKFFDTAQCIDVVIY